MKQKKIMMYAFLAALAAVMTLGGCAKKVAKVTPPPPPASAPPPTVTLAANPSAVQPGQSSTLTWQTSNANEVMIAGLGTLPASGSRAVTPGETTTYTLVAKGAGGTNEASASVSVNAPVTSVAAPPTDEELFRKNVKDVFFDYDKFAIRADEVPVVQNDEVFLAQHPAVKVLVEGHCDDRGSEEYNIALGANRAESVKETLVQEGVPADRIKTVSYGKEKPFCHEDSEQCWQQNRVDHFAFDH
jgi:peptidoglycan-associated lipoprotein